LLGSKNFEAGPAKVRVANVTDHVIATTVLFNGSLAFRALLYINKNDK